MLGWQTLLQLGRNMQQLAIVTRVEPGHIWIRSEKASGCKTCSQRQNCGTATINQVLPVRELRLASADSYSIGDRLYVSIDDSAVLRGVLLLYGLPLLVMLLVSVAWDNCLPTWQTYLPVVALLSLLISFVVLKWRLRDFISPLPHVLFKSEPPVCS